MFKESDRILVVGTTPDYIEWLRRSRPDGALFLTDRKTRDAARENSPGEEEEITCDLTNKNEVYRVLERHLREYSLALSGITCFDCEYLDLASAIAYDFRMPYPTPEAVWNCRNKYLTRVNWQQFSVPCPRFQRVFTKEDVAAFAVELGSPFVLKPLTGSGSELVFRCESPEDGAIVFEKLRSGFTARSEKPMYHSVCHGTENGFLMEQCIEGEEYSCDYIVEGGDIEIVRMTKKHPYRSDSFGTTGAYELLPRKAWPVQPSKLKEILYRASASHDIRHAWCMMDFMYNDSGITLLEITPRPGGDCLPWLLRTVGVDVLGLVLDYARGSHIAWEKNNRIDAGHIGLRLFADREGMTRGFDYDRLLKDPRVLEVYMRHESGHVVHFPPEDYDSWILGHVVYAPDPDRSIDSQNKELASQFTVLWE